MQYGLLGGKLGHSLSPKIHEFFFKYTGVTGTYELLETELEALPARVEAMCGTFAGSNVTIPHKIAVIPMLDSIALEAEAIGAVNTICPQAVATETCAPWSRRRRAQGDLIRLRGSFP